MGTEASGSFLGGMLATGLQTAVISPDDILRGITAKRLAEHLPPAIMAQVFTHALDKGAMSPESVLEVAGPQVLAMHMPAPTLAKIITGAVRRAGLAKSSHKATPAQSTFLKESLMLAFSQGLLNPELLLDHATPAVLCEVLPLTRRTALLKAGLDAKSMTPALIVDTLGLDVLAKHLPGSVLWAAVLPLISSDAKFDMQADDDVQAEMQADDDSKTADDPADGLVERAETAEVPKVKLSAARRKVTPAPARSRSRVPPRGSRSSSVKLRAASRAANKK